MNTAEKQQLERITPKLSEIQTTAGLLAERIEVIEERLNNVDNQLYEIQKLVKQVLAAVSEKAPQAPLPDEDHSQD